MQSRTNSTYLRVGQLETIESEKRNSRSMCADFAAHGRPLRDSPSGDPEPPLDTVRGACAHLPGPCCFLLSCPLLPPLFPSLFTLRLLWPATQSLCGGFLLFFLLPFWFFGPFFGFSGVFCRASCQPTEVTKDYRVLPAPSVNTHLATVTSSPSRARLLEVGLSLNSFVVCLPWLSCDCPSRSSVLFCKRRGNSSLSDSRNSSLLPWGTPMRQQNCLF